MSRRAVLVALVAALFVQPVRTRNRESVFIYAKPARNAKTIELLILAHENDETVLIRVVANAEIVGR